MQLGSLVVPGRCELPEYLYFRRGVPAMRPLIGSWTLVEE